MSPDDSFPPAAAVILAAGAATRMGRLKQLLPFGGRTLLEHSIEQALQAGFDPVVVVIGAEADVVRAAIAAQPVDLVWNEGWETGMGSSIAAGMTRLLQISADSGAVAILLADQPLVNASHLIAMRSLLHLSNSEAVAAQYGGTLGVPAVFARRLFPLLESLPPDAGARRLLRDENLDVAAFPLAEAATDIDTPEDFAALV